MTDTAKDLGQLRRFTVGGYEPTRALRVMDGSPLILVQGDGICYANSRGEKDRLVKLFLARGGLLMFVWQGQFRSDVFEVTAADVQRYYRA